MIFLTAILDPPPAMVGFLTGLEAEVEVAVEVAPVRETRFATVLGVAEDDVVDVEWADPGRTGEGFADEGAEDGLTVKDGAEEGFTDGDGAGFDAGEALTMGVRTDGVAGALDGVDTVDGVFATGFTDAVGPVGVFGAFTATLGDIFGAGEVR